MNNFHKLSAEVSIIPVAEEQILSENEIVRKYSNQEANIGNIFTISNNSDKELPSQHEDHKHHHHHHHQGHPKHHKHREHHKHIDFTKEPPPYDDKDYSNKKNQTDWEKPQKKQSKFQGRPKNETLDPNGPPDKFHIVRIMFFILGLIHILPYTFFTTANEYWMYKFRNTTINSTDANDRTYLQTNFQSLSNLITIGPSTVCQFLLTFLGHKIAAKTRIFITLIIHSLVFVIQTTFVKIDTDDWQVGFFCVTVGAMTLLSCSMSLGSTGNMVTISQFPDQYLKMYMVGESVASLMTSGMRLISIVSSPTTIQSALIYFITGTVMMIVPTILLWFSTRLEFYKYYTRNIQKLTKKRIPRLKEFKEIIGYTWPLLLMHIVSMLIPHAYFQSLVVSEYYGTDSVWGTKYFVTCCTYLLPAVCGMIGRSLFYKFEINPSIILLYVIHFAMQAVYTPLMFFVNAKPRSHLPVLFPHDWQYALIVGSQSLIGGYTMNMGQMKSLRIVPKDKLELSILVNLFVFKILSVATSPIGLWTVTLL